jgi:hypothetical protein
MNRGAFREPVLARVTVAGDSKYMVGRRFGHVENSSPKQSRLWVLIADAVHSLAGSSSEMKWAAHCCLFEGSSCPLPSQSDARNLFGTPSPNPFLLKRPRMQQAAKGGHVKNLRDLWQKSPERLDTLGGEELEGSGFECEEPDIEFAMQELGEEEEE